MESSSLGLLLVRSLNKTTFSDPRNQVVSRRWPLTRDDAERDCVPKISEPIDLVISQNAVLFGPKTGDRCSRLQVMEMGSELYCHAIQGFERMLQK